MSETVLLEGGCPCTKEGCPNHGDCARCVLRHVTQTGEIVACLREKAKARYGEKSR